MFHSAALKLTTWYLSLIMLISIAFSGAIYHVSYDTLMRDARRQTQFIQSQLTPYDFRDFNNARQRQLDNEHRELISRLVIFNILVLAVGGFFSYQLARRTLLPIEGALEAQTRFTGDASHELRTPLTAMQTEIEVALRDPQLNKKEAVELLQSNLEEVQKLKALSEGLLRLASTESKASFSKTVALKPTIEQAVERWGKSAQAKQIELQTDLKNINVRGDSQSLIDLVSIFIDNAIKYSPEKSRVIIEAREKEKFAVIRVEDRGQGIKASDLPHIFDRFYRADNARARSQPGGYGLGLAIAKKIVELHKGFIEVKSAPGKGSIFTIYIPQA